ncbi:MAG: hypothetical protein K6T83_08240 [Alicyclobacillus sp.]|nr:hypothetical protein [Alicyclobacillus sp.]
MMGGPDDNGIDLIQTDMDGILWGYSRGRKVAKMCEVCLEVLSKCQCRTCDQCLDTYESHIEFVATQDGEICPRCATENYQRCVACGDLTHLDDLKCGKCPACREVEGLREGA